jgi:hypothetical protein
MGIITFCLKINGPINLTQNQQDWSSNCPDQNGINKLRGRHSHKKLTLLLWKEVKTSFGTPWIAFHTP